MSKTGVRIARAIGEQGVKFGMSSNNNLQVSVTFQFSREDDEFFGQSITWIGTFAPGKASEIALEALENCGWTGDDVMDMTGIDANEVELVIVEKFNADKNKNFDEVSFVNRPGANRFTFQQPVEGSALAAQSRILGQNIRAIRASQGRKLAPAAARPRPQPAPQIAPAEPGGPPLFGRGDDDLTF
jgi:hypothetical protein